MANFLFRIGLLRPAGGGHIRFLVTKYAFHPDKTGLPKAAAPKAPSPQRMTALSSFMASMKIPKFNSATLLDTALTHKSANLVFHNHRLAYLGGLVLTKTMTEHAFVTFPELHDSNLKKFVTRITTPAVVARIAKTCGLDKVFESATKSDDCISFAFKAVVGAVLIDQGSLAARNAVLSNFQEALKVLDPAAWAPVDGVPFHIFEHPKAIVLQMLNVTKAPMAEYRILENGRGEDKSGRKKDYGVTIFSGEQKLGIGYANTRIEAEYFASRDAVTNHFKIVLPPTDLSPVV